MAGGFSFRAVFIVAVVAVASQQAWSLYQRRDELPKWDKKAEGPKVYQMWVRCLFTATGLMQLWTQATKRGFVAPRFARKGIHISMGLVFMWFWPLFPDNYYSRFAAATVPLLSTVTMVLVGTGALKDPALQQAATRSGSAEDLLDGPLIYGVVMVAASLYFWRHTPVGIIALAVLCAGDGFAELVGRGVGGPRVPYNSQKTITGSLACLIFGFAAAAGMALYFDGRGTFSYGLFSKSAYDQDQLLTAAAVAALAGTLAESLPQGSADNLSTTVAAGAAAHYALTHGLNFVKSSYFGV